MCWPRSRRPAQVGNRRPRRSSTPEHILRAGACPRGSIWTCHATAGVPRKTRSARSSAASNGVRAAITGGTRPAGRGPWTTGPRWSSPRARDDHRGAGQAERGHRKSLLSRGARVHGQRGSHRRVSVHRRIRGVRVRALAARASQDRRAGRPGAREPAPPATHRRGDRRGSGIGKAAARRFVREGAHVVVADLDRAAADAVSAEINATYPGRAVSAGVDVRNDESLADLIRRAVFEFGGIDCLFYTAGQRAAVRRM